LGEQIIGSAALILVAVIEAAAASERRRDKHAREQGEKRAEARAMENRLAMRMMDASLELGLATAIAVEQGRLNGEMKAARAKARAAQDEYDRFIQEIAAGQVAKV